LAQRINLPREMDAHAHVHVNVTRDTPNDDLADRGA